MPPPADGGVPSDQPGDAPVQGWPLVYPAAGYVVSYVLSGAVAAAVVAAQGSSERTVTLTLAALLGLWAGMVGAAVVASRRAGTGRFAADLGLRFRAVDVPLGIAVGVVSQFVLVPLLYLPVRLLAPEAARRLDDDARELLDVPGPQFLLLAAAIIIAVPLVEELFFRGLVQNALVPRLGPGWGVAVSSVVFGVVHYQLLQLPALVVFGAVLGVLAHRTGRLGAAVVAHAAFDAATVVAIALSQ